MTHKSPHTDINTHTDVQTRDVHADIQTGDVHADMQADDVGTRLIASDPDGTTTMPTNNRIDIANMDCINDADAINRVPTSHNWPYKRFSDVMNTITPISKIDKSDYMVDGQYPIISQEETFVSGYWNDSKDLTPHSSPVVIFGDHSRIIKYVDFEFVVGADGVKIIQPSSDLNAKFLYHYLKWYKIPALGYARHFKLIKEALFPVPPMGVQERIVAELDRINRVIEDCRELLRNLDSLAQSLFYDTFGDPVTNPKGWEMKPLKEVVSKIGSGATPKGGKQSYLGGNIYLIRSLNVYNNYFKYDELAKIDDKQAYELKNVEVQKGDVLLNITGASVARCFIVPYNVLPARVNQHVAILRPIQEFLLSIFLHRLIITTSFQNELIALSRSKNATREALPKATLENIIVPVPPLALQQEFAERVEEIEGQKMAVEETIKNMQTLLDSRMDFWFN